MDEQEFAKILRQLRKQKGFAPLTPPEAQKAFGEAKAVPISEERIKEIVNYVLANSKKD